MTDRSFGALAHQERREALTLAANKGGSLLHLTEKDVWVVETLSTLVDSSFGSQLTFKGGTSLVKVWRAIRRFSEDIDITYDIREFAPDLTENGDDEALPPTRSQEKRWTKEIRRRLAMWVREVAKPAVESGLARDGFDATIQVEGERLFVSYEPTFDGYGFIKPVVTVDFGARSTGEPREAHTVVCDAAAFLPDLSFPAARPLVMLAERTFWEKATAMHVFCLRERGRGHRLSRHWHDVVRLDDVGVSDRAITDCDLAHAVARHQDVFFREKDAAGNLIDCGEAASGNFRMVPEGKARDMLAADYDAMQADGVLLGDTTPFSVIMDRSAEIEVKVNDALRRHQARLS